MEYGTRRSHEIMGAYPLYGALSIAGKEAMKRRSVLKGLAAIAASPSYRTRAGRAIPAGAARRCRLARGAALGALRRQVGGSLLKPGSIFFRPAPAVTDDRRLQGRHQATRQSLFYRRSGRRHAGLGLAECLVAAAQRLRRGCAQARGCGGGSEFRPHPQASPGGERRRPFLSGHVQRAGFAPDLDPAHARHHPARCFRARRESRSAGARRHHRGGRDVGGCL